MKKQSTISAKQHPTLIPEAQSAIEAYQDRIERVTGVKPNIAVSINSLIILGERKSRELEHEQA